MKKRRPPSESQELATVQPDGNLPYPVEGTPVERDAWHFKQFWWIRDQALTQKNFIAAISCQTAMYKIDHGAVGEKLVVASPLALAAPVTMDSDKEGRLEAAFRRSHARRQREAVVAAAMPAEAASVETVEPAPEPTAINEDAKGFGRYGY